LSWPQAGWGAGVCDEQKGIWTANAPFPQCGVQGQDGAGRTALKTMADLCKEFELHPTQFNEWKRQLLERAVDVFGACSAPEPVNLAPLHAKMASWRWRMTF
jgi:hypothetical protein